MEGRMVFYLYCNVCGEKKHTKYIGVVYGSHTCTECADNMGEKCQQVGFQHLGVMMDKRTCTECLSVLPIIDFPKSGGGGRGGVDANGIHIVGINVSHVIGKERKSYLVEGMVRQNY